MTFSLFVPDAKEYLEIDKSQHSSFQLHYHLIWAVKYRRPLFTNELDAIISDIIFNQCGSDDIRILGVSVSNDHVHCIMSLSPKVSVADAIKRIKGKSSVLFSKSHPGLLERMKMDTLWQNGYRAESLGWKNVSQIKSYLDGQEEHHDHQNM